MGEYSLNILVEFEMVMDIDYAIYEIIKYKKKTLSFFYFDFPMFGPHTLKKQTSFMIIYGGKI